MARRKRRKRNPRGGYFVSEEFSRWSTADVFVTNEAIRMRNNILEQISSVRSHVMDQFQQPEKVATKLVQDTFSGIFKHFKLDVKKALKEN